MPIEELLLEIVDNLITVNLIRYEKLLNFHQRQLIIWLLDTWEFFRNAIREVKRANYEFRGHFVVILGGELQTSGPEGWNQLLNHFWSLQIITVVLAVAIGEELALVGYQPYSVTCCRCVEPVIVNRCNRGFFENRKIFKGSLDQLHGCPLRLATFKWFPFRDVIEGGDGQLVLSGKGAELMEIIQSKLNFTVNVRVPTDGFTWGQIFPNGSAIGALGLVFSGEADFTLGGYLLYQELLQTMSITTGYYVSDFVFVVPEELVSISSLKRLLQPFQITVWISVLAMLGLVYAVFSCYNGVTVGHSFKNHSLLMLYRSLMGGSLPSIPRGNFIRFAMLLWLYYGVVIRESYNCAMYGFLTAKPEPTDISSFAKMAASGYQFVVSNVLYDLLFANSDQFNGTFTLVDEDFFGRMFADVIQSRKRIALISQPEMIAYFNKRHPDSINFRISEEKVLSFYYSMLFRRACPLIESFNVVLGQILGMGLISNWKANWMNERYLTMTLSNEPVTVLTNEHLFDGYTFYALGIAIAVCVFFLEIIGKRVAKLPPAQQEDIIETMMGLIDATERMNRSAAFGGQAGGFNLTKSVSSFALTSDSIGFGPISGTGGGMDVEFGALTSSPSNLV
ncbi:uncharacterized protein LOC6038481 [Culex quinquefasciatus]|uniref:uncharacterized protein LOC6038481 n=1 Tax=Culex quinquefasciatus TaxID=7176 RepID=UPI0018E2C25F|nr:uncharacterized protein LOC6038481 [Culex quinquefasciatus]